MKRFIVFFIIGVMPFFNCCRNNHENGKDEYEKKVDSVSFEDGDLRNAELHKTYNEIELERYDTVLRDKYVDLALKFFEVKDLENFKKVSKKIEEKSLDINDTVGLVQSKCFLATYYGSKFQNDSIYYYYSKAEKISRLHEEAPFLGSILMNKAELLTYQKDFSGAESLATKALRIGKNKNDHLLVYNCYLILGKALKGMDYDEQAMVYYLKALKEVDFLKSDFQYKTLKAQMLNYISLLYQKEKRYEKSIYYAQKGLDLENFETVEPTVYCYLKNSIAYSEFKKGNKEVYKVFNKTLKLGIEFNNLQIQLNSKFNLSEYYLSIKDTMRAVNLALEVLGTAHNNKVFEDELKALELLAKIDPYHDSSYNKRYITLNDSLQNVERATRDKFARIEFETDEITNEKNIVEAKNRKISTQLLLLIGLSLFVFIAMALAFIVYSQRLKNRELRLIQQQQQANAEIYQLMLDQQQKIEEGKQIEKRRISKELHDGVLGKLSAIRLNLFVLGKRTDPESVARCMESVDEIQNIEKEIRKISHDLNHNLFADASDFTLMVTNLMEAAKGHSQLEFKLVTDEKIDWNSINNFVKMQVYRILQEALHNIQKYARAKSVYISMTGKEGAVLVSVTDDGVGFDSETIKPGIGHKNMRERADEINGKLTIWSEIGKGTQINLTILT